MMIAGYFGALVMGVSLGLLGGGGSIFAVPILYYLFGLGMAEATSYSLFLVGFTSGIGALSYIKKRLVFFKAILQFGLPSIVGVFLTRQILWPILPTTFFKIGDFELTRDLAMLILFAMLMLVASYKMIRPKRPKPKSEVDDNSMLKLVVQGLLVGGITGLMGVGGGFLIIPALVILLGLEMKLAIGTSLVLIALNSFSGFLFSLKGVQIDWKFLAYFSVCSIVGVLLGSFFNKKIEGSKIKPAFGVFVFLMGVYVLVKELLVLI